MSVFGLDARIPVVMYHAVGNPAPGWIWPGLACPEQLFARQVALLADRGYRGATLADVRTWQDRGRAPRERLVVLTFDDGYLDTWALARPYLKRHGLRGLVYVNPDFVEPGTVVRPTLEDVWAGRIRREELPCHGFLNWAEIAAMAREGVVEIGSHSRTHTWYETGPEIVGYHGGGETPPWLAWNARPDRKHAWLSEMQADLVPLGTPIHVHGRALGIRRWRPDASLAEAALAHVATHGGDAFFAQPHWRADLDRVVAAAGGDRGRFETDAEREDRLRDEILISREEIAGHTGEPVRHFAWPGGAYDDQAWRMAAAAGFDTVTVKPTDLARWSTPDPMILRRMTCRDQLGFRGRTVPTRDPVFLLWSCEIERGRRHLRWPLRLRKAAAAFRAARRRP